MKLKHDVESGTEHKERAINTLNWNLLVILGYTILVHMCEEHGKLPFSSSSVNLLIEISKLSVCVVHLLRSRLGLRAVQHLFWLSVHFNLIAHYLLPACLFAINANINIHMQLEMDPISNQICICGVALAPDILKCDVRLPPLTCIGLMAYCLPATLYFINNNLAVHMQLEMDPATYQMAGNFKILTTVIFYRIFIKRPISKNQWVAVFLLLIAAVSNSYGGFEAKGADVSGHLYITLRGIAMVLVYCLISGAAGVYTEFAFKHKHEMSIYVQSGLMYLFGSCFNLLFWLISVFQGEASWNLLEGYSWATWVLVATQAFSGLMMGAVMKHGSNITRLFIISTAMLVTTLLSIALFRLQLNVFFTVAFMCILAALTLYHELIQC